MGYFLSTLLFLLMATVVILLTSNHTLEWVAQRYAPEYGFGYKKISGGIFGGVKIEGLTYKDDLLLESAVVGFNPIALLNKKISIPSLELKQIDIDNVQKVIDAFTQDSNESEEESSQFDFEVEVGKFEVTLKPFVLSEIAFEKASLIGSDLAYNDGMADAKNLELNIESNITALHQKGTIEKNRLLLHGSVSPKQALFDTYQIPLKKSALKDLKVAIEADQEKVKMNILLEGKKILGAKEKEFDIDQIALDTALVYRISEQKLEMTNEGNISTPYAKNIRLSNSLNFQEERLEYNGSAISDNLVGLDKNLSKPLKNLKLSYSGTDKKINVLLDSDGLKGAFDTADFKRGDLNLSTKRAVQLGEFASLPKELAPAWARVDLRAPIDFADINATQAKVVVQSNLANIDAKIAYNNKLEVEANTTLPQDSLLKNINKELRLEAFSPLSVKFLSQKDDLSLKLDSKALQSMVQLNQKSKSVNGDLILLGTKYLFSGNLDKEVKLENKIGSLKDFVQNINKIYPLEAPPLDGDVQLSLNIKQMKAVELLLNSKKLQYKADNKTFQTLEESEISLGYSNQKIKLNHYKTTFDKQKIFATKPSEISLKDQAIVIAPLWVNDELQFTGVYDLSKNKGELLAKANPLNLSLDLIESKSNLELKGKIDGDKIRVDGTVTLLEGKIHYDLDQKRFVTDSDIVIVQNIKKSKPNPYLDNLIVMVKVNSDKPITYKNEEVDIKANSDLLVEKAPNSPLQILGKVEFLEGSYYTFEEKKFVLKKSYIYFTGDPSKSILDITAKYKAVDYDITIQITGDPQTPNVIFSSVPRLSREEILAVILFDSKAGAGSNSGDDMMKMMGGAMAKSALSSAGIKIDYLSLGSKGEMEVGKRLSEKVTIIYVNDKVSGAKLQYDYSGNIKAILSTDAESSGADIIYKREFEKLK